MRRGKNKIFLFAIAGSIGAHLLFASISSRFIRFDAWTAALPPQVEEMTVVLPDEPEQPKPPELDPELQLGDPTGTGYASFAAPGLREQLAKLAENDQAALSLDPRGSGTGGDSAAPQSAFAAASRPPIDVVLPKKSPTEPPAPRVMPAFGVVAAEAVPKPVRAQKTVEAAPREVAVQTDETQGSAMTIVQAGSQKVDAPDDVPARVDAVRPLVPPTPVAPPPPQPVIPPAPQVQSARAADPSPQSESEVDPFSSLGSVEFREGNLSVRAGRQIKPRRPKLTLAGRVTLVQMQTARVVLGVSTDATGKVTSTEVLKSSGSVDIDQPVRVAMYDWWFEPKKDATGHPVPDRFRFEIVFH